MCRVAVVEAVRGVYVESATSKREQKCKLLTVNLVLMDESLSSAVAVVVVNSSPGTVDGELLKVGAAVSVDLSIKVRKDTALQQRVLGEVDTTDNVSWLEHDLLGLGKIVGRVGVQLHDSQLLKWHQLLRKDLCGIEEVETVCHDLVLVDNLHAQLPLGIVFRGDGVPEILTMHVCVLAGDDLGLLPNV